MNLKRYSKISRDDSKTSSSLSPLHHRRPLSRTRTRIFEQILILFFSQAPSVLSSLLLTFSHRRNCLRKLRSLEKKIASLKAEQRYSTSDGQVLSHPLHSRSQCRRLSKYPTFRTNPEPEREGIGSIAQRESVGFSFFVLYVDKVGLIGRQSRLDQPDTKHGRLQGHLDEEIRKLEQQREGLVAGTVDAGLEDSLARRLSRPLACQGACGAYWFGCGLRAVRRSKVHRPAAGRALTSAGGGCRAEGRGRLEAARGASATAAGVAVGAAVTWAWAATACPWCGP